MDRSGMTRDEIQAFFDRRQAQYDALDAKGLASGYADDAVIESPMLGSHTGPVAVEKALHGVFSAFKDWTVETERILIDGDVVAQVATIGGTQIGHFMGLPPSGKHFRAPFVAIYEMRERKIVHERRIYDFTGLLVQIGVLKAKPAS